MSERAQHLFAFGPYQLDPAQRLLFRDSEVISLTPKALDTLLALVQNSGRLLTKEELLEQVWPGTFVEEVTLAKNVSTLRKVLGAAPGGGEYIETHSKRGYRFVAEVREIENLPPMASPAAWRSDDASACAATGSGLGQAFPGVAGAVPAPFAAPRLRTWRIALLAMAGMLLVSGVFWWTRLRAVPAPAGGKIMLAVLPFENLSADAAEDYFSSGLTEEMITQLGRLEPDRLGVIARTSAMQYKGAHKDARQIGAELGVDYLLEGSVRREGSRVRIAAQLIQVRDQSHQWAENYDRDLRDILAVQSDVAGAIAQQIRLQLTPAAHARLENARAVNPQAYENYLKGRYFWNKRSAEGHQRAIEYFQRSAALDPAYAPAYAGLADAYALLGSLPNTVLPRHEAMNHSREAAQKALSLEDSLAEAHASLGFVKMHYDWDFAGAEREYQRAIALDPGYATAHHWYAYDLVALARLDDALAEARRAQQADPLSVIISRDVGEMLLFAHRSDEAIAQCRKTLEMDPKFVFAHWTLAWAYKQKGQTREFLEELGNSAIGMGSSRGILYAIQGQRAEARSMLASFKKSYGSAHQIASVYGFLAEKDRAFSALEEAYNERDGALIIMHFSPEMEPLFSDPRFAELERRVGVLR